MRVAIIGPSFFGYLEDIASRLCLRDVSTTFYDERPSNSVLGKIYIRFAPKITKQTLLTAHINKIITSIMASDTTHVLLVSVEVINAEHVKVLKNAGIKVCRYGWDSVKNKPKMFALDPLMDRIASFDRQDCNVYGYISIPLFSAMQLQPLATEKKSDFFYCTTLHSNRPQLVANLKREIDKQGFVTLLFLFYHNRLLWFVRYALQPRVWHLLKTLSSKPFSHREVALATQQSRAVIDMHHGAQSGLTMRTFEALSLGAILLTTNTHAQRELPSHLAQRVVFLDINALGESLRAAQKVAKNPKLTSLSEADRYALSVDRFLDQITALLSGKAVPNTFSNIHSKENSL